MKLHNYLVAVFVALAMLATACGSSDDTATPAADSTTTSETEQETTVAEEPTAEPVVEEPTAEPVEEEPTAEPVEEEPVEEEPMDEGADPYAPVGPADASLEPITIGYMSFVGLAATDTGFELGVRWVNEDLGGINGRPLEYIPCGVDLSPESSIACATQFIEAGVSAVAVGADPAAGAALPVLADAGIVMLQSGDIAPPLRERTGNAYIQVPGARQLVQGSSIVIADEWGVDSVAFVSSNTDAGQEMYDLAVASGDALGFEVSDFIAWDLLAPDWDAVAASVVASGAESVFVPIIDDGSCISLISSLAAFAFEGPRLMGACGFYRAVLPPEVAAGIYHNNPWVPTAMVDPPEAVTGDHDALRRLLEDVGQPELYGDGFVEYGFMQPAWLRDVIATAENPDDPLSVRDGAAKANGPRRPFATSPWACDGSIDSSVSSCGSGTFVTVVTDDLSVELIGDLPIDLSRLEG